MSNSVAEIFETMEYGPAPENADAAYKWLSDHKGKLSHYIGGDFISPDSGEYMDALNPATGEKLISLAKGNDADIDKAVKAARKAYKGAWGKTTGAERARYLYSLARLLQKHGRILAVLETLDNGKTIRETRDIDIPLCARHFYHHAGWAQLMEVEFPEQVPHGVVGQIIPWNFPLLMLAWKIAPALAAGNTVVLKPAEFTSLTAIYFAELCRKAGLPDGVVNIVLGDGEAGASLVNHDDVDKLAFTGSTDVGKIIRKSSAGSGKALTLELGGKSPIIVFDDADLDSVVEGVVDAIWFNQGEVCCGGSRLLVQEGVYDRFIDKLKTRMETLRQGDPLEKTMDIGAVVDKSQYDRIKSYIDIAKEEGGTVHTASFKAPEGGCFYPPTLITNVEPTSTVMVEEIFGPVVSAMSFRTADEAMSLANNTRFGLACSIWTENINLALEVTPKIRCGVAWINGSNMFDAAVGFGGVKETGYGREGGREGMYAYMKPAYLNTLKPYGKAKDLPEIKHDKAKNTSGIAHIDRTAKMYVGGKQARPDGNYNIPILNPAGHIIGEAGEGNRKDIRNAVEAASKAASWAGANTHLRAQIIYYIAENLDYRKDEFIDRIRQMTGASAAAAKAEVEASINRIFSYGAWADKFDGAVHSTPSRTVTIAMNEPVGNIGIICPDEAPLLAFISLVMPAFTMGNRVVVIPSERHPLAATDFYQILETSDVPAGTINIVTGKRATLTKTLAEHDNLDALWYFGPEKELATSLEAQSIGNLKRTWTANGLQRNWQKQNQSEGKEFLRQSTEVKNIWVPYGEVGNVGGGGY